MTLNITPIGVSKFNPGITSGERINIEQANFDGGNNSQSIMKNLIRLRQDYHSITQYNRKIDGFQLSKNVDNSRFINVGVGNAMINGRWITNNETIIYQPQGTDGEDHLLLIRITESTSNPRNPESDTVSLDHQLYSTINGYTPTENELVIGLYNLPHLVGDVVIDGLVLPANLIGDVRAVNTTTSLKLTDKNKAIDVFDIQKWSDSTNTHLTSEIIFNLNTALKVDGKLVLWRTLLNRIAMRIEDFSDAGHTHRYADGDNNEFPREGGTLHLTDNKFYIGDGDDRAYGRTLTGAIKTTNTGVVTLKLNQGQINVGSSANEGVPVTMSGDATITTTGAVTVDGYSDLKTQVDDNGNTWNSSTDRNSGRILTTFHDFIQNNPNYFMRYGNNHPSIGNYTEPYYDLVYRFQAPITFNYSGNFIIKFSINLPSKIGTRFLTLENMIFHCVGRNINGTGSNDNSTLTIKVNGINIAGGSNVLYNSYNTIDTKTVEIDDEATEGGFNNPDFYPRRHDINYINTDNPSGLKLNGNSNYYGFIIEMQYFYYSALNSDEEAWFRITPPNIIYNYSA